MEGVHTQWFRISSLWKHLSAFPVHHHHVWCSHQNWKYNNSFRSVPGRLPPLLFSLELHRRAGGLGLRQERRFWDAAGFWTACCSRRLNTSHAVTTLLSSQIDSYKEGELCLHFSLFSLSVHAHTHAHTIPDPLCCCWTPGFKAELLCVRGHAFTGSQAWFGPTVLQRASL